MKAAVLRTPGGALSIEEVSLDPPGHREVRVRIAATGVCHSDLSAARGSPAESLPMILGHEAAGIVDEVGQGVERVAPGDRVILSWAPNCGHCFYCHNTLPTSCDSYLKGAASGGLWDGTSRLSAGGQDGKAGTVKHFSCVSSYAEYAVVPEAGCIRIADDVPFDVAALVGCAVTTGFGAVVNDAKVKPGASVVVSGVGGVGINAIQSAALSGARTIIAVDINNDKEAVARKFGATDFVNPAENDALKAVRGLTEGRGADAVIECTGRPPALDLGYELLRNGGTLVVVGIAHAGEEMKIAAKTLPNSQKRVIGSNYGGGVPEEDIKRILDLYRSGRLDLDSQIGERIPLEAVNEGFKRLREGVLARSVITFPDVG